jgi:hypothetical protein
MLELRTGLGDPDPASGRRYRRAAIRRRDQHASSIGGVPASSDEPLVFEAIDQGGHRAAREAGQLGQPPC